MCNIDYKKSIIESTLTSAKLFHDDRLDTIEPIPTPSPPSPPTITHEIPTHVSSSSLSNLKKRFSSSSSTSSSRKKKTERHSVTEILKIKEDTDQTTNINNNESSSSLSQHNYVNQDLTTAESDEYEQEDFDDEFNIISNKNLTQHEIGRKQ